MPPVAGTLNITEAPDTISMTGSVVSLDAEVERVLGPRSFDEQIRQDDQNLRRWMAKWIVWTFIGGNALTLVVIAGLAYLDQNNIGRNLIDPTDRIITYQVPIALLGATTVQVGTIAAIIARYLFPGRLRGG